MNDIREQIKGARVFAALAMTKSTHHLCGIKVELLTDTLEKLLAVYEAADKYCDTNQGHELLGLVCALNAVQTSEQNDE